LSLVGTQKHFNVIICVNLQQSHFYTVLRYLWRGTVVVAVVKCQQEQCVTSHRISLEWLTYQQKQYLTSQRNISTETVYDITRTTTEGFRRRQGMES